jgi:thiosulfate/3-mercaptopyruvate sulfurtransferase
MSAKSPFVVSPQWLAERLGKPGVSIVDASWYLPDMKRDAKAEHDAAHILGAVFFDIDAIADTASSLPHMLPSEREFARIAGRMGISEKDTIIVYDGHGLFSAARVWWTFRTFGAAHVFILDGGLPAWKSANLPLTNTPSEPARKVFESRLDLARVVSKSDLLDHVNRGTAAIADARSAARFAGTAPEPRAGLRGGHMPGAASVPFNLLVDDGKLKSPSEIEDIFKQQRLDLTGDVVTTCGSGVTAAVISLALESIGHKDHALYDGAWAEWGMPGDTPVVLGSIEPAPSKTSQRRFLKAHITELDMKARPAHRVPLPIGHKILLMKPSGMAPSFYRYLYEHVGKPHHWFIRRGMSDEQLQAVFNSGVSDIWVMHVDGCPAGFFEIDLSKLPLSADIHYFGLIPHYQGRGLSKFMLSEAVAAAWDHQPGTVSIQTNTLDSPRALVLYQKAGFEPVGAYDELIEAWD